MIAENGMRLGRKQEREREAISVTQVRDKTIVMGWQRRKNERRLHLVVPLRLRQEVEG